MYTVYEGDSPCEYKVSLGVGDDGSLELEVRTESDYHSDRSTYYDTYTLTKAAA